MRNEHVVASEDNLSIDLDRCECVKAVENKFMDSAFSCRSDIWKLRSVSPTFVGYPFAFELVET
jgi:hypothetical protein